MTAGKLFLVATPIGNLQDITLRAIDVLGFVDLVACEDTRHSRKLLNHFEIQAKTISLHEHNERDRSAQLVAMMLEGKNIAVVSDAGTPAISDPGSALVAAAIHTGIDVVPIPGAVAFVNAAIASGIDASTLIFAGFLPSKKGDRRKRLEKLATLEGTLVLYEAPHRLAASLADCFDVLGPRRACIARELTKLHEAFIRGTLDQLAAIAKDSPPKGEIVLVIEGFDRSQAATEPPSTQSVEDRVRELEAAGDSPMKALKKAAKEFGLSKAEAYKLTKVK